MRLTEKKRIKIDSECRDNPIYLCWLNSLGGISYWLFSKNHTETTRTRAGKSYVKNISDLETAKGNLDFITKEAVHSFKVGARVLQEDMDGIEGLFESPKVQMLMNPATWQTDEGGARWQNVQIKTGSLLVLDTATNYKDIQMEIQMPFLYKQAE